MIKKDEFYVLNISGEELVSKTASLSAPSVWTTNNPENAKKFGPDIPKGWSNRYPNAKMIKVKVSYEYEN